LRAAHAATPDNTGLGDTAHLLYGMALLAEGGELAEPAAFVTLLSRQLEQALPPAD
jgi:molecular chaperone HtpG